MTVTSQLLRLYLVDKQLRGLKSRLKGAEAFLLQQDKLVADLDARVASMTSQVRQLEASYKNDEVEVKAIDDRTAMLRDRMNNAKTSKEHSALLTEISTLKADKKPLEDRMLEAMGKIETLKKSQEQVDAERAERLTVRDGAARERDARAAEIRDRVAELEAERETAKLDVIDSVLLIYEERLALGVEDVMAPIEEQDRRNMEYTCGSCYTHLPIERVSILLKRGDLTKCPSCQAILYIEKDLREDITTSQDKKKPKKTASVDD